MNRKPDTLKAAREGRLMHPHHTWQSSCQDQSPYVMMSPNGIRMSLQWHIRGPDPSINPLRSL